MVNKVSGDSFPTMLVVGLSSQTVGSSSQAYDKNYYSLRWLRSGIYASNIGCSAPSVGSSISDTSTWGTNNRWYRVTYHYNRLQQTGTVYVDGIAQHSATQNQGWYTLPDGKIFISLFSYGTNSEPGDNGIEAFIDNLGFYTL